jgi:uncharacterized membrane protein
LMGVRRLLSEHNKVRHAAAGYRTEGLILLAGIVLALLYLAALSLYVLFSPRLAQILIGITASNLLFGRAVGMSVAYTFGFGHGVVIPLNMLIESILVLLFYPLFVFSLKQLLVMEWLRGFVDGVVAAASRHRHKVERYGVPGLILFVWFPFSMTGPMVGSVIGYFIGLKPKVNIAVVLGSTYVAILCWGVLLRGLLERAASKGSYASTAVAATIIAVILIFQVFRTLKKREKVRRGQDD